jgi:hypothetical protein
MRSANLPFLLISIIVFFGSYSGFVPAYGLDEKADLGMAEKVVREGMTALSLTEGDIRPRHDFIPKDAYRLGLIDKYLNRPLTVFTDPRERFFPWIMEKESLTASLIRAGVSLGYGANKVPKWKVRKRTLFAALSSLHKAALSSGDKVSFDSASVKRQLKAIPKAAHPFLAQLLQALEEAIQERTTAFKALSGAEWVELRKYGSQINTGIPRAKQVMFLQRYHSRIDIKRIFRASLGVAAVLERIADLQKALEGRKGKSFQISIPTSAGRIEFGGWGKNHYKDDALLTVDFGGDDMYANSAGGTLYTPHKVSVCIDLQGDDIYDTSVGLAQGSGMYGIGMLVDCSGNDQYTSKNVSQGSGHVGVGVLWDWSGDDRYKALSVSQGAGFQGVGLLRDDEGKDLYTLGYSGQGFGKTLGFGILQDRAGNDMYTAGGAWPDRGRDPSHHLSMAQGFGEGNRSGQLQHASSGGIGLLAEMDGNDTYVSDVFGQGCAYWYAIGVLLDRAGNDVYKVHNYGQGAGFHMAVGILMDREGDDRYECPDHAMGHSLDRSVGFFVDFSGNDSYTSADSESIGAAVKPYAVAFFVDMRGDDSYRQGTPGNVRIPGKGWEGKWPKAFFLDLGGKDTYAPAREGKAQSDKSWVNNTYGWGTDRE